MKLSILLTAGLVSAFPRHISRRDAIYYDRSLSDRSSQLLYDAVYHYPRGLDNFEVAKLFVRAGKTTTPAKTTPATTPKKDDKSTAQTKNTQPATQQKNTQPATQQKNTQPAAQQKNTQPAAQQKNTQAATQQKSTQATTQQKSTQATPQQKSTQATTQQKNTQATTQQKNNQATTQQKSTQGGACKLGKRAPGDGCGGSSTPNHDWKDIVGKQYPTGKGSDPNSWEKVKPASDPSHKTEKPTQYPVNVEGIGKTARVVAHASTHPMDTLTSLAKTAAPITAGVVGSAASKNPKILAAGVTQGFTSAVDNVNKMDETVKGTAQKWKDGAGAGHSMTELSRMQNIDNGVKATTKAVSGAMSSAGSAASKGWGALKNTVSALGSFKKGSSTSGGGNSLTRQNTNEFEMVDRPVRRRSVDPFMENINRRTQLRRRLVRSLQARYMDEYVWS